MERRSLTVYITAIVSAIIICTLAGGIYFSYSKNYYESSRFQSNNYYGDGELKFPSSGGRHENSARESWFIFFHLKSNKGNRYSFHTLFYVVNETIHEHVSLTDISNDAYYSQITSSGNYTIDPERLNITLNSDNFVENKGDNFNYTFFVSFEENKEISLNVTIESNKYPITTSDGTFSKIAGASFKKTYYYAQTNLNTKGILNINGKEIPVSGSVWIDREWGNRLAGVWDWLAIQLDNDYEIIANKVFPFRSDSEEYGLLITPRGGVVDLSQSLKIVRINFTQQGFAKKWNIRSEKNNIDLIVTTTLNNQSVNPALFEGSCTVEGMFHSKPVKGLAWSEQLK